MKTDNTYKKSGIAWIAQIPYEWEIKRLKDIGFLYGGLTGKSGDDFNVEDEDINFMYFIPFTNIFNNSVINPNQLYKVKINIGECQNLVEQNDILFLMSSEDFDGVGKPAILEDSIENLGLNSFCKGLRITDCGTFPKFLFYFLSSHISREQVRQEAKGFIRINLRQDKLSSCCLILPPLDEQKSIANFLDTKSSEIDSLISLQEDMIDDLLAYKQSIITEAVIKGLNPKANMVDSGIEWIGEIPDGWSVKSLSKIIWLRARLGWKGLKAEEYVEEGYPFLSAFNIVNNKLEWTDLNFINQQRYDESPEIKLSVGDVIIVKDGAGIGKTARIDSLPNGESTVNSSLGVITPSVILNYQYLYYFLLSNPFQNMVGFLKNGMGVPHLTQENMKSVQIPVPGIEEQHQIAIYLDEKTQQIDSLISLKRNKIEELKDYKQSIIYEYVTGKKRV